MKMDLDPWQKEIKAYNGNILLGKGRRIGATYIMAEKAVDYLFNNYNKHPSSQIVCVSITDDQAQLIIAFATNYARSKYSKYVGKGKNKPTLKSLTLVVNKNKRILLARPVGATGDSVRGFEGQILMVDEAPKMPKLFWASARPILATTGGKIWMWGTFFGKDNYFYEQYLKCFDREGRYKVWLKTTPEVFEERKTGEDWTKIQREEGFKFLKDEEEDMSALVYAQEYLGIASEALRQAFPDDLIKSCQTLKRRKTIIKEGNYYLGVDVAGMGRDPSTFEIFDLMRNGIMEHVENQITRKTRTTETSDHIIGLNKLYNFRKELIDSGGIGRGVCDELRLNPINKRKVMEIDNSSRVYGYKAGKELRKKFQKEDGYAHLQVMMERGKIKLLDDYEIFLSLKSVQVEILEGKLRYYGNNIHIAEGIWRAVWGIKTKGLKLFIA